MMRHVVRSRRLLVEFILSIQVFQFTRRGTVLKGQATARSAGIHVA
jgi:hypothetical protein